MVGDSRVAAKRSAGWADRLRSPARDHEKIAPGTPTLARDDYYRRMFDQVIDSCQAGRALQAANFWAWGGEGRSEPGINTTATGFTGDPFPEPQGLNSVFDTDTSSLAVIAAANRKLSSMAKS